MLLQNTLKNCLPFPEKTIFAAFNPKTTMRIDINQKKMAIGDKFSVVHNQQTTLKAASKIFRILSEIEVFRADNEKKLASIKKKFAFFKARYHVEIENQAPILFNTESYWKNHFRCINGTDTYDIYGHRGRKFSIFKNDQQVAWFTKEAVTFFEGDNYMMMANDDADQFLMVCFVLIVDNYRSKKRNNNAINIDLGNVFQARPFDKNWLPQEETATLPV
ncbi:hypothetical protein DMA11_12660 [Marinilabiliaceae bacterium JC017]|nr:hypothetical protein DMA11_12660 [Marinilabiliaceae bacterium JC017]